nr:triose-phosphate isomerase [Candidatus Njordarchaeota archaeon]
MKTLERPLIILNFKCYHEAMGSNAVRLARIAEKVAEDMSLTIVVAPTFVDIQRIVSEVSIPVFSQHVDPVNMGSFTGFTPPEAVKEIGAVGTLINHSERRLLLADIDASVSRAKEVGLHTCICTNNSSVSAAAASLEPTMIAVEPPELIGSGRSVSKTKPEVVTSTVKSIRRVNDKVMILCGAGIATGEDVRAAIRLGTEGVLLASAFTKAVDPEKVLRDLANGVKNP